MKGVKVGVWMYKIEYREFTDREKELIGENADAVAGFCIGAPKRIVVRPAYKDDFSVLIHEVGHAIDYEYPIAEIEDSEARADLFAMMLIQIILDNPELVRKIASLRKKAELKRNVLEALETRLVGIIMDLDLLLEELKEVRKDVE